jgi:NAD(P)-dependent dehydrogenase (short-subunit alcohol dehydrogenase family)
MHDDDKLLQDKVVLVTGGGRGLGAAICRRLVRRGAQVVVADLREQAAIDVAAALSSEGGNALAVAMDVGDAADVERALDEACARTQRLDAVVNNAGVDVTCGIAELSVQDWDRVLKTNLSGPFYLVKSALPRLLRSDAAHVVNIVSTAARRAWPNASVYHASKWGLLGLSHAMHAELRPQGIKVTAVLAGGMRTPFLLDRFPDIPLENLQDPDNVARAVVFALMQPAGTVVPEMMVLPMNETSWP